MTQSNWVIWGEFDKGTLSKGSQGQSSIQGLPQPQAVFTEPKPEGKVICYLPTLERELCGKGGQRPLVTMISSGRKPGYNHSDLWLLPFSDLLLILQFTKSGSPSMSLYRSALTGQRAEQRRKERGVCRGKQKICPIALSQ